MYYILTSWRDIFSEQEWVHVAKKPPNERQKGWFRATAQWKKNWKESNNKLPDLWFWHLLAEFMHPWKFSKEKRVFGCKICHKWCHHRYQSFSAFTIEPRSHCSDKVQLRKYSWVNEALTQLPNVPITWYVLPGSNVHPQASLETHVVQWGQCCHTLEHTIPFAHPTHPLDRSTIPRMPQ